MKVRNILYDGKYEVLFDSFKHDYSDREGRVTGVTTALSIISKPALVQWAANMAVDFVSIQIEPGKSYDEIELQSIWDAGRKAHQQRKVEAGNIGTFVHRWVESYVKGENPGLPVNEGLQRATEQFMAWVNKHEVKFLASEQMVASRKYRYAGTLDFICTIDGKRYLGDLKTSSGIWTEYMLQTAAYRFAREEEFPDEKYEGQLIIRIGKDGEFEFAVMRDYATYNRMLIGFLAALKLYQTMEMLKEYRPERE